MRCTYCAGQIAEGSRFCGICGRRVPTANDVASAAPSAGAGVAAVPGVSGSVSPGTRPSAAQSATKRSAAPPPSGSRAPGPAASLATASAPRRPPPGAELAEASGASLFELPVSRGARVARVALVLVLDAALVVAGVAMILSYVDKRAHAVTLLESGAGGSDAGVASPPQVEVLPPTPVKRDGGSGAGTPSGGGAGAGAGNAAGDGGVAAERPDRGTGGGASGGGHGAGPATGQGGGGGGGAARQDGGIDVGSIFGDGSGPSVKRTPDAGAATGARADAGSGSGSGSGPSTPTATPTATIDAGEAPGTAGGDSDAAVDPVDPYQDEEAAADELAAKIALVVKRQEGQLQRCYTQAAKSYTPDQPLEGTVDIQFEVMPTGEARNVRVADNTTGSDQLASCVAGLVESWSFPETPGPGSHEFRWPFKFRAPR